jgi:hypothetical protein
VADASSIYVAEILSEGTPDVSSDIGCFHTRLRRPVPTIGFAPAADNIDVGPGAELRGAPVDRIQRIVVPDSPDV